MVYRCCYNVKQFQVYESRTIQVNNNAVRPILRKLQLLLDFSYFGHFHHVAVIFHVVWRCNNLFQANFTFHTLVISTMFKLVFRLFDCILVVYTCCYNITQFQVYGSITIQVNNNAVRAILRKLQLLLDFSYFGHFQHVAVIFQVVWRCNNLFQAHCYHVIHFMWPVLREWQLLLHFSFFS